MQTLGKCYCELHTCLGDLQRTFREQGPINTAAKEMFPTTACNRSHRKLSFTREIENHASRPSLRCSRPKKSSERKLTNEHLLCKLKIKPIEYFFMACFRNIRAIRLNILGFGAPFLPHRIKKYYYLTFQAYECTWLGWASLLSKSLFCQISNLTFSKAPIFS